MKKIHNDFPVYFVKNFHIPLIWKKDILKTVLKNKNLYFDDKKGYNFPIINDYNNFFKKLYKKFYSFCEKNFIFTPSLNSSNTCWAYVSDKNNFNEVWHNHLRTSTINAVYYLNIPKNDNVTIDFELNGNFFTHIVNNYDLIIFPNYLNHKPNRCYKDGYRISINMEIICNESSNHIFNSEHKLWQIK